MQPDIEDLELEAECRVLGSLLSGAVKPGGMDGSLGANSFQHEFHGAVFHMIIGLALVGRPINPEAVWLLVNSHENAEHFGIDQLTDLAEKASSPETFNRDCLTVSGGFLRRLGGQLDSTLANIMRGNHDAMRQLDNEIRWKLN